VDFHQLLVDFYARRVYIVICIASHRAILTEVTQRVACQVENGDRRIHYMSEMCFSLLGV